MSPSSYVYRIDTEGLRSANALVAWLDGPMVDDGTACEIGMFAELVRSERGAATAASSRSRPTYDSSAAASRASSAAV